MKFSSERSVCAPQYLSDSTCTSPKASVSVRVDMLRRCKNDWLLFVNGVGDVKCFGAGLGSDRRACDEGKTERESMLESQNNQAESKREEVPRWSSMGLVRTRGLFFTAPRHSFGDDIAKRYFPSPRSSDWSKKIGASLSTLLCRYNPFASLPLAFNA